MTFALLLTTATLICGLLWLYEKSWHKRHRPANTAPPTWLYHPSDLFPMLLLVWLLRSFVAQPYRVPSGSLIPTVLPGDFMLVNQQAYGLRNPINHHRLQSPTARSQPQRGDIALFGWPVDPDVVFIKRVIGLPGDTITYRDKTLSINAQPLHYDHWQTVQTPRGPRLEGQEDLLGQHHRIQLDPLQPPAPPRTWHLGPGEYFMMGDNRDNSHDSRYWGSVPDALLIGKAWRLILSWDAQAWDAHRWTQLIRWTRLGRRLNP